MNEYKLYHLKEAIEDVYENVFVDGDPINDFSHITVSEEVCK